MKTRKFGKTDWQVAEIGLGCWGLGGNAYGPIKEEESKQTLLYAYDQGVNFFDTADSYGFGKSETLIGETIGHHKDIYIATKVGYDFYNGPIKKNWDSKYVETAVEKSLQRLKRETIDLYQLHNPSKEIIEEGTIFETLEKLKQKGKIQEYGISIYDPADGILAIDQAPNVSSIQTAINLLNIESTRTLLPYAKKKDVAIIAREPLACGLLTGRITPKTAFSKDDHRAGWSREKIETDLKKIKELSSLWEQKNIPLSQIAFEFVLNFNEVSVVIPGAKRPSQAESNLNASKKSLLTKEIFSKILSL